MTDLTQFRPCPCCGTNDLDQDTIQRDGNAYPHDIAIAVCMGCGFQICAPNWRTLARAWNAIPPMGETPPSYQVMS